MNSGLHGCTVWVTRPQAQALPLCRLIEQQGGQAVHVPAVAITPCLDAAELRDCLALLPELLIFCSRNAVLHAPISTLLANRPVPRCIALGSGTACELRGRGVRVLSHSGAQASSEAVLTLPMLGSAAMRGCRVLLVKGEGGRTVLQDVLGRRGAHLRTLSVYRRRRPVGSAAAIEALWVRQPPDIIVITSSEGLHALCSLTPEWAQGSLDRTRLAVLSRRIAAEASRIGFVGTVQVAAETSDAGLLRAMVAS